MIFASETIQNGKKTVTSIVCAPPRLCGNFRTNFLGVFSLKTILVFGKQVFTSESVTVIINTLRNMCRGFPVSTRDANVDVTILYGPVHCRRVMFWSHCLQLIWFYFQIRYETMVAHRFWLLISIHTVLLPDI